MGLFLSSLDFRPSNLQTERDSTICTKRNATSAVFPSSLRGQVSIDEGQPRHAILFSGARRTIIALSGAVYALSVQPTRLSGRGYTRTIRLRRRESVSGAWRKAGEMTGEQTPAGEGARESAQNPPLAARQIFETACQALREGMFPEAIDALESLLEKDVEFPGAASALKCAGFWKERGEKEEAPLEGFERGEQLLGQWRLFQAFAERLADVPERCMFAIKQFVFSTALAELRARSAPRRLRRRGGGGPVPAPADRPLLQGGRELRARHRVSRAGQPGVARRCAHPRGAGRLLLAGERVPGGEGVLPGGLLRGSAGRRPGGAGVPAGAAPGGEAARRGLHGARCSTNGSRCTAPSGGCSA